MMTTNPEIEAKRAAEIEDTVAKIMRLLVDLVVEDSFAARRAARRSFRALSPAISPRIDHQPAAPAFAGDRPLTKRLGLAPRLAVPPVANHAAHHVAPQPHPAPALGVI